jgi:putative ABC transport system substrate-binding protein
MKRRDFLKLLGASALAGHSAQAREGLVPVVGMLNGQSEASYSYLSDALQLGLKDGGFVEGQNVLIEHRWAEGRIERLPAMALELVNRPVDALVTGGSVWSTIAAKAVTATIPIVFTTGTDPVNLGFVTSLNRPGGNVTGVSFLAAKLNAKRLELASQLAPKDAVIGFLARPGEPRYAADRKEIEIAAAALGRKLLFLDVAKEAEFDATFAVAAQQHLGAVVIHNDPFFNDQRSALVALATRYFMPIVCESREFATAGALVSYGASITGAYRQAGVYIGRILKGDKAGDLPVIQSSRFEMVINLKTAKALGMIIPSNLLISAEVIE